MKRSVALITALVLTAFSVSQAVTVSSKNFTEQLILGEMLSQALSANGVSVTPKLALGGSAVVRKALEAGEVDMYPEYTGTAVLVHFNSYGLNPSPAIMRNPSALLTYIRSVDAKKNKLSWLCPSPANNTYALVVRKEYADKYKLKTIADLAKLINSKQGDVVFASNTEFINRADGLKAFQDSYKFQIAKEKLVIIGQGSYATAQALANGSNGINVAMAFGTDGTIPAFNLVVLQDTKKAMPIYNPSVVVRQDVLKKDPKIQQVVCSFFPKLDDKTLAGLNSQVDVDGKRPAEVARDYLRKVGVVK